jgi:hypothetical protein
LTPLSSRTNAALIDEAAMDDKVELVARAIHQAEHGGCLWVNEPVTCQDRFREYARNAIDLLKDDISVLLGALERCSGKE